MRWKRSLLALLLAAGCWTLAGCGQQDANVIKRDGEPDYVQAFDEDRMDAAIAEAAATIATFSDALKAADAADTNFSLKKGFAYGDGGKEFIWINEVTLVDGGFQGRINNEPVNDVGVALGQLVTVVPDDVADWMFMRDKRMRGGFTIAALVYGSDEQAAYEQSMGMDWSQYKFLSDQK